MPEFIKKAMEAKGLDPVVIAAAEEEAARIAESPPTVEIEVEQELSQEDLDAALEGRPSIPAYKAFRCSVCEKEYDGRTVSEWREVVGWEQKRVQGGTNHIAEREQTGRSMCNPCMILRQSGRVGQGTL